MTNSRTPDRPLHPVVDFIFSKAGLVVMGMAGLWLGSTFLPDSTPTAPVVEDRPASEPVKAVPLQAAALNPRVVAEGALAGADVRCDVESARFVRDSVIAARCASGRTYAVVKVPGGWGVVQ